MSYATEREYNRTEKAIAILELLRYKKCITIEDAMREAGCSRHTVWRILYQIERVIPKIQREGRLIVWEE